MRILFLSPRQCWPPRSGAKLREYHFLRALSRKAEVVYVHFQEQGVAPPSKTDLPFCAEIASVPKPRPYTPGKVARGLVGSWPLPVLNYRSTEMERELEVITRNRSFDFVHLDSIHVISYVERLKAAYPENPPRVVYNWHNIESELMRRYSQEAPSLLHRAYAARTSAQLHALELEILQRAWGHVVCSDRERRQLQELVPHARIVAVPNGVDTQYFAREAPPVVPARIVFVGLMNYHPNVEAAVTFAKRIWPAVRERLPAHYRLTLVGADPSPAVLALRELDRVEVTGTVPDVRTYYKDALAAIVPLRTGGGTRLKILESMAAGVPVISTALGAEGLDIQDGRDILITELDNSDSWVKAIEKVLDPAVRERLTATALRLVRERYDWDSLGDQLCEAYAEWSGAER